MVEGAPMRFPGGTFFQIRGFVLGLGRQVHQGTDGTLDACQSQTPGKQKCARDFPCSRFQYPQKIHGTFFPWSWLRLSRNGAGLCPVPGSSSHSGRPFFVRVRAAYVIQKYFPRGRFEMQLRGSRSLAVCYCSRFRNPSCDFQSSSAVPQRMVKRVMPEWGCRISRSETGSLSPSRTIAVLLPLGNHSAWTLSVSSVAPPRPQAERADRMPGSRKNADRMETVSLNSVWKAISLFL